MIETWAAQPRIAVLGGSFNPPHIGHLRMAIEVFETLRPERVLLVPAAAPPHKPATDLLPFTLRLELLRASARDLPGFFVSALEGERAGPSYTIDTLSALSREYPGHRLSFILGATDFAELGTWRRWREIPALADLIVVSREDRDISAFTNAMRALWPDAVEQRALLPGITKAYEIAGNGAIIFMPVPRLDISSSDLRRRWLAKMSIQYLVPPEVERLLADSAATVAESWQKEL